MEKNIRILVVDDDDIDRETIRRYFRRSNLPYVLETVESETEALNILEKNEFDLILLDYNLRTATAFDILPHTGNSPVIFVTGGGSEEIAVQAMRRGAYDYLVKDPDYNYLNALPITIRSVLKRKEAENALRDNEERFRALTEKAADLIMILNHKLEFTYVSPSIAMFGYSPAEINGKKTGKFIHADDISLFEEALEHSMRTPYEAVKLDEIRIRRKNNSWALLEGLFTCMLDQPGVNGIVINGRDITVRKQAEEELQKARDQLELRVEERTKELKLANEKLMQEIHERKKSEDALRKSEERLNKFMDSATEAFFLLNANLNLIDVNKRGLELLRLPEKKKELAGKNIADIMPGFKQSGSYARCLEVIRSGHPYTIEDYVLSPRYGELRGILKAFKVGEGLGIIIIDTTRSKQLEEQLRQALKMEALGNLAGGIAHDFNNILGIIMGFTELAFDDIPGHSLACSNLRQVLAAVNRAKEMVKQIMAFSRENEKKQEPVYLDQLLREVLKLLKSTLPPSIKIQPDIDEKVSHIYADSTQMHQVIMNICTNAVHAMKKKGGILNIRLKETEFQPPGIKGKKTGRSRYLHLEIADTGHGMTTEIKKRIFEPYFTTKKQGEGTGMGLAVAHGIVKSHDGDITVSSKPREGTTFHIYLPAANAGKNEAADDTGKDRAKLHHPNERILFVNEENNLAKMAKNMLESLGYRVVIKHHAGEAVEIFTSNPDGFDLAVIDQVIPGMTGERLAFEFKCIKADTRVILCVGSEGVIDEDDFKSKGIDTLIRKPILLRDMATAIRDVLDDKKNGCR
jgi:PAS domain S-box-containing protein